MKFSLQALYFLARSTPLLGRISIACLVGVSLCLGGAGPTAVLGQSTVISLDPASTDGKSSMTSRLMPNNIPEVIRQVEQKLAQPVPSSWGHEIVLRDLAARLKDAGISLVHNDSLRVNGLSIDDRIELPAPGMSIATNLRLALREYDAGFTIDRSGAVMLMSDEFLEEKGFYVVVDISGMDTSPVELVDGIQETTAPDSWEENGGAGRISLQWIGDRVLLQIDNEYDIIQQVLSQIDDLARMSGVANVEVASNRAQLATGKSTIVQLPSRDNDPRMAGRSGYRSSATDGFGGGFGGGGGGFGGAGLGGGVF